MQVLPSLPRLNVVAQATSSDLGSYSIFSCSGTGTGRSCGLYTGFTNAFSGGGNPYQDLKSPEVSGTLVEYVEVRARRRGSGVCGRNGAAPSRRAERVVLCRSSGDGI